MINTTVYNINAGFSNCIFMNKDAESVSDTMMRKMYDASYVFVRVPKRIDLVPIDDMHDTMILDYSDNGTDILQGTVTWGRTSNGLHYVFKEFKEN